MNKEIEEILNKLKNKAKHCILYDYEVNLLLSYIEQLEKEIHKKEAMYDSLAVDYRLSQEQNEQLKNNRNKAIEYLKEKADYPISYYHCIREAIDILNGDSDD